MSDFTIPNLKTKKERVLKFMTASNIAVSRYSIMRGTGIPYHDIKLLVILLEREGLIETFLTSGHIYYKVSKQSVSRKLPLESDKPDGEPTGGVT